MAGTVIGPSVRRSYRPMRGYVYDFTADSADGSYPQANLPDTGLITGVTVVFGDPAPDNIDIAIADQDGVDRLGGQGQGFTGTGKVSLGPPEMFVDGLIINLSGNTVNGARLRVVAYVI